MGNSKIDYDGRTLIDLTGDTVTKNTLARGTTAHGPDGEPIEGEMPIENVLYIDQTLSEEQKTQARTNIGAASSAEVSQLSDQKAEQSDFISHTQDQKIHVTQAEKDAWDGKSNFSGKYEDLTGNPTIPSKTSQLTNDSGFLTQHQDLSEYTKKNALTLGVHSDGLMYLFIDGQPVGVGVSIEGANGDIIGNIEDGNIIVLSGSVADGTYSVKYEMEDGRLIDIGNLVYDTNVYYTVTNNLTQCVNSNSAKQVASGKSYSATITAKDGYTLKSVTVTMGGSPVTVSGGTINIANVTGNIVITAVAEVIATEPTNFAEPNTTNTSDWSIWCNNARFGGDGTYRAATGNVVTNYIPLKVGDTLYFEGLNVATTGTDMTNGLAFYDGNKTNVVSSYLFWYTDTNQQYADASVSDGAYTITINSKFNNYTHTSGKKGSETEYVRISGKLTGSANDVVIRVKRNGQWL